MVYLEELHGETKEECRERERERWGVGPGVHTWIKVHE